MTELGQEYSKRIAADIDECASDPCNNNGFCEDLRSGYRCSCEQGYTGVNCETGK